MDGEHVTIETVTQLLHQQTFPTSVEAALMAIRECSMFTRQDLFMLASHFIFCYLPSPSNTNPSQTVWIKTLNNIQELQALDIIRKFLENQSDIAISTHIFGIIFIDVLSDPDHPLFLLHYKSILKLLSLAISFESKTTLTIIARCFLSKSTTMSKLLTRIIENIIYEHIALAITKTIHNICLVSPLFTLCFIQQTCLLLDEDNFIRDKKIIEILIELITYGLTHSTNLFLTTLKQEFNIQSNSLVFNFVPSLVRLDVFWPLRISEAPTSLCLNLDHFHTAILSFLFSIAMNNEDQNNVLSSNLFSSNYFEQLAASIQDFISHNISDQKHIDQCLQRYLQILAICKTTSLPLTNLSICDLGKKFSVFTHYNLFHILKHREEQETGMT